MTELVLLTSLVAVAGAVLSTVVIAAARKVGRIVVDRRRPRLEEAVRPSLVRILAGQPLAVVPARRSHRRTLELLAVDALGTVRGEAHVALGATLEALGTIDRARRVIRRPGAVRRARAAEILGAVGDGGDLAALGRLLRHRSPEVRQVASRALGRLSDPAAVPLLLGTLSSRRGLPPGQVSMAIWRIGAPAIEGLRAALADGDQPVRLVAAQLLGELGAVRATPDLLAVLGADPDVDVRRNAAVALGRIGGPLAVPALIACLEDDVPVRIKIGVTEALARIGAVDAVPALLGQLDRSHDLARAAASGLVAVGPVGRQALAAVIDAAAPGAVYAREALGLARLREAAKRAGARRARRSAVGIAAGSG